MMLRLTLVLGILTASPALAAKPFGIPWAIVTEPITWTGTVAGVPIGPFDRSGSWDIGGVGSGSVSVRLVHGVILVESSGSMGPDARMSVEVALKGETTVPDLGEATTTVVFALEGEGDGSSVEVGIGVDEAGDERPGYLSTVLERRLRLPIGWELYESNLLVDSHTNSDALPLSLVAGDRIQLPLAVYAYAACGLEPCSWSHRAVLTARAIAPEPENRPRTQCFDRLDNDRDGEIDLVDADCTSPFDGTEAPPPPSGCGVGPELALLLPALWRLRRARKASA